MGVANNMTATEEKGRVDGGKRVPGGHNGAAVSDPQDINRNEDLAQQCQRRQLRLRNPFRNGAAHEIEGMRREAGARWAHPRRG